MIGHFRQKNGDRYGKAEQDDSLTDRGQYRLNSDLGTSTVLRRWLSWQLTFSDRYLSNPIPGRKSNDVLLTTGLRFAFQH